MNTVLSTASPGWCCLYAVMTSIEIVPCEMYCQSCTANNRRQSVIFFQQHKSSTYIEVRLFLKHILHQHFLQTMAWSTSNHSVVLSNIATVTAPSSTMHRLSLPPTHRSLAPQKFDLLPAYPFRRPSLPDALVAAQLLRYHLIEAHILKHDRKKRNESVAPRCSRWRFHSMCSVMPLLVCRSAHCRGLGSGYQPETASNVNYSNNKAHKQLPNQQSLSAHNCRW